MTVYVNGVADVMKRTTFDPNDDGVIEAAQIGRLTKADFEITLNKLLEGAGAGADPTEIDVPTGAALTLCDTEVFNGNSPGAAAWTDLNLSGVVGANPAIVWLRVTAADGCAISFRPNGETEFSGQDRYTNSAAYYEDVAADVGILIALTDGAGIVEWKDNQINKAVIIDVIGYIA